MTNLDGDHGYYNNESAMHPIFIAHGPAFKQSFKIEPFKNVDIYPLMCSVLGVEPAVHNGTLDNVKAMLVNPKGMMVDLGFGKNCKFTLCTNYVM
jgi:ectonucleotide pyrophosphatase/phosphodiesterase family protein 5